MLRQETHWNSFFSVQNLCGWIYISQYHHLHEKKNSFPIFLVESSLIWMTKESLSICLTNIEKAASIMTIFTVTVFKTLTSVLLQHYSSLCAEHISFRL